MVNAAVTEHLESVPKALGFALRTLLAFGPCLANSHEAQRTSQASSVAALTQRGVESLFPTDVVDGPEDLRFVSYGET